MPTTALHDIVRYSDRLLRTEEVNDYGGAVNGLQVENRGTVTRINLAQRGEGRPQDFLTGDGAGAGFPFPLALVVLGGVTIGTRRALGRRAKGGK